MNFTKFTIHKLRGIKNNREKTSSIILPNRFGCRQKNRSSRTGRLVSKSLYAAAVIAIKHFKKRSATDFYQKIFIYTHSRFSYPRN